MYCIMSMTIDVFAIHNEEDKLQLLMIYCGGPILLIKGFSLNLDTKSYIKLVDWPYSPLICFQDFVKRSSFLYFCIGFVVVIIPDVAYGSHVYTPNTIKK